MGVLKSRMKSKSVYSLKKIIKRSIIKSLLCDKKCNAFKCVDFSVELCHDRVKYCRSNIVSLSFIVFLSF